MGKLLALGRAPTPVSGVGEEVLASTCTMFDFHLASDRYELPGCNPRDANTSEASAFRRMRRRVLAEFELAEDDVVEIHGVEVHKSQAREALNELRNKRLRSHHLFIYRNPGLCRFLMTGDLEYFENGGLSDGNWTGDAGNIGFLEFVVPSFAEQFSGQLRRAVKKKDVETIEMLFSAKLLVPAGYEDRLYGDTHNYLKSRWEQLLRKATETLNAGLESPKKRRKMVEKICQLVPPVILNVFPEYFAEVRNRIGKQMSVVAVQLYNEYDSIELAERLLEREGELSLNQVERDQLEKNRETLRFHKLAKEISELLEMCQNERDPHQTEVFGKTPPALPKRTELKLLTEGKEILDEVDVDSLNDLPPELAQIRENVALMLRNLSVAIWNNTDPNDGAKVAQRLLRRACTIDTKPDTAAQLKEDRKNINEQCRRAGISYQMTLSE